MDGGQAKKRERNGLFDCEWVGEQKGGRQNIRKASLSRSIIVAYHTKGGDFSPTQLLSELRVNANWSFFECIGEMCVGGGGGSLRFGGFVIDAFGNERATCMPLMKNILLPFYK